MALRRPAMWATPSPTDDTTDASWRSTFVAMRVSWSRSVSMIWSELIC